MGKLQKMARLTIITFFAMLLSAAAFTAPSRAFVAPRGPRLTVLSMSDEEPPAPQKVIERGVSIDQDGKSNVWAIEPKVEVETKSAEEKTTSALLAAGGGAVFIAAAAVILTNSPDPNTF